MAFSPLRTQSAAHRALWSATRRRRKAETALREAAQAAGQDPPPTTVNDGSEATPGGRSS